MLQRLVREVHDRLIVRMTARIGLRVHEAIARQLMTMSDSNAFTDESDPKYQEVKRALIRHAVPALGRRLSYEENLEIRELIVQTLGNIGGREAIDALARAVAGDERVRKFRQDLLSTYYLEPSKARSEEAAKILTDAVEQAKTTLWWLRNLNIAVIVVGIVFVAVSIGLLLFAPDGAARIGAALAGVGGIAGMVTLLIRAPMNRIQQAMGNLVQIETAFTSFIWELNLNGTYIQSQYVAEGILSDGEIARTVDRIQAGMNHAMNLVAIYTLEGGQRVVTRINTIEPAVTEPDRLVTVAGQYLHGDTSTKKATTGMVAINHLPVKVADMAWTDRDVKLKVPASVLEDGVNAKTIWISLFVDGMETNALPLHVVRGA
jgi:hypothetical protein